VPNQHIVLARSYLSKARRLHNMAILNHQRLQEPPHSLAELMQQAGSAVPALHTLWRLELEAPRPHLQATRIACVMAVFSALLQHHIHMPLASKHAADTC
jgi:hypothetical protein